MATFFIVPSADYLTSITDPSPRFSVETVAGHVPVQAVGTAHVGLLCDDNKWQWLEVHDVLVVPSSPILYSTRAMAKAHGLKHRTEDGYIVVPAKRRSGAGATGSRRVAVHDTGVSYDTPIAFARRATQASRQSSTASVSAPTLRTTQ